MASLTALDMMVLLAVAIAAVFGLMRGFVSEIFSLAAWVIAIMAVKIAHEPLAAALTGRIGTSAGASVLAFALIFGITFLVVRYFGRNLGKSIRSSLLGPVDRLLGLGFGALKGLIIATVAFLFMSLVFDTIHGASAPRPDWMTESRTYPLLRASSAAVVDFMAQRRAQ